MAEQTTITFREWLEYMRKILAHTRKRIGMWAIGRGLFAGMVTFFIQEISKFRNWHDTILMIAISFVSAVIVFLIEFVFHLITAPARTAKEEQQNHNDKIGVLTSELNDLKVKMDDRTKRRTTKDSLAQFRIRIQNLHRKLNGIPFYSYYDKKRSEIESEFLEIHNTACRLVQEKIGISEAATLDDNSKIEEVVAPSESNFDMPAFRERWIDHKHMNNRLECRNLQLEKIEEKLSF